jgi:hypothetical protein
MGRICKVSGDTIYSSMVGAYYKTAQPVPDHPAEVPEEPDNEFEIPEYKMEYLRAKIDKLNKTAEKLGLHPIVIEELGEIKKPLQGDDVNKNVEIVFKQIRILGQAPKLNGWTLAARILHTEEGNIIKAVPNVDVPTDYRNTTPICEHCKTNRDRRDTFVVRNDGTGQFKQVGRNCLADFLGHPDPLSYARFAELLSDLFTEAGSMEGGENFGGGGGVSSVSIESYLLAVAALGRAFGYVSRAKAKERMTNDSTAEIAFQYCTSGKGQREIEEGAKERGIKIEFRPEDEEQVKKSLDWARKLKEGANSNEALSDYLWNLAVASSSSVVTSKSSGIVASLLSAYQRANSAVQAPTGGGKGYVGEVNKPLAIKGTIGMAKPISSYRGQSTIYSLQDEAGNTIKWFDNTNSMGLRAGEATIISGVVKAHKEYMGKPETELTGVRVLTEDEFHQFNAEQAVASETAAKAKEKQQQGQAAAPAYAPGQRVQLELTLLDKRYIEREAYNRYDSGKSTLHMFVDAFGRNYKWFTSSADMNIGDKYQVTATIKGEDDYKGVKSTVLTRVTVQAVGGKKAVTRKDLNAKSKEVNSAFERLRAAQEGARQIQQQINEFLNEQKKQGAFVAPEYSGAFFHPEELNKVINGLKEASQHAREALTEGKPFTPKLPSNLDYSLNASLQEFSRPITPAEFLEQAMPIYEVNKQAYDDIKQSGLFEQHKQIYEESEKARQSGMSRWDMQNKFWDRLEKVRNDIHTLASKYKNVYILKDGPEKLEEKFTKLTTDVETAKQAQASGQQEFKSSGYSSDWGYDFKWIFRRPLSPHEFIQIAEKAITDTVNANQKLQPFLQQHQQAQALIDPIQQEYDQKSKEYGDLEAMLGRPKEASLLDWVRLNCKFANKFNYD